MSGIEKCQSCCAKDFAIARDMIGTRHCKCGNTWAPFFKSRIKILFDIIVLCLGCNHRWFETVTKDYDLLAIECPKCGMKKSFPSFIPNNFYSGFEDEQTKI